MRLIRNALMVLVAYACDLQAQTVISNNNLEFHRPGQISGAAFGFTVWQTAGKTDVTGLDFKYDGTNISLGNTLIDEGSDWYVVQPGDAFSRAAITAGQFTPIFGIYLGLRPPVTVGSDFYLGVSTGQGFNWPQDRTVYGWVHLTQVSGIITMIDNVLSYDSPGIIVGTTTLVPEPATFVLFAFALPALIASFRRRRP